MANKFHKRASKVTREKFFVRVETGEGVPAFIDSTDHIGMEMPFRKPRATLGMSVSDSAVTFSLLHISSKQAKRFAGKIIEMPRGPLSRLARRSKALTGLAADEIVIEISQRVETPVEDSQPESALGDLFAEAPQPRPRPANKVTEFKYRLDRTGSDVSVIEADEEFVLDLPFTPIHMSMYLRSPATEHVIAVNFIGHLGKPGTTDTVSRLASKALNSMLHLPEFSLLSGLKWMELSSTGSEAVPATKVIETKPVVVLPVYLFTDQFEPVVSGQVTVTVDIDNANGAFDQFLTSIELSEEIAKKEVWDIYKKTFEAALHASIAQFLGDEDLKALLYEIVLGGLDDQSVQRIVDAVSSLGPVDLTYSQWKSHT